MDWPRIVISAVVTGIIAGGGAAISALTEDGTIGTAAMAIALLTGLVVAAKDVQSTLSPPPAKGAEPPPISKVK
jgi:hypothetical protein